MAHRDRWERWARLAGVLMLAFLVLGGGLCLFDHDGDGADDHAMAQDLCLVTLVVSAVTLLVSPLARGGAVAYMPATGLVERPRLVPVPPPRTVRSA